jgi:2-polyprenyl-3-methyl-5-hydroxy-6-metoxy-1,4-benzoquinol methylase
MYDNYIKRSVSNYYEICQNSAAELKNFKNVLDAGCGTGTTSVMLAKQGNVVTCIDESKNMLNKAREKAEHIKIKFRQNKIESLRYKNKFDGVICNLALYLTDRTKSVPVLVKALKHNGKLVITEMCPDSSITNKILVFCAKLMHPLMNLKFLSKKDVILLLKKQKLKNIKSKNIGFGFFRKLPVVTFTAKKI